MTKRDIIINGVLQHPFQTVLQHFGQVEAIEWGERCLYDSDTHTSDGKTFPLSGFPFQTTYAAWKAQNAALVSDAMEAVRIRDANRRLEDGKRHALKLEIEKQKAPKAAKKTSSKTKFEFTDESLNFTI